jgi:hypothetical protein
MLRSARGDWRTPTPVVVDVRSVLGSIDLDPSASLDARDHFALVNVNPGPFVALDDGMRTFHEDSPRVVAGDGLAEPWTGRVFVNPPFGDLAVWTEKAARAARSGAEIVFLLPARTDTAYWHEHVATAQAVCFLRGRLRFVGAPAACPFPTALAYWGPRPWEFHRVFSARGMVVVPSAGRKPPTSDDSSRMAP